MITEVEVAAANLEAIKLADEYRNARLVYLTELRVYDKLSASADGLAQTIRGLERVMFDGDRKATRKRALYQIAKRQPISLLERMREQHADIYMHAVSLHKYVKAFKVVMVNAKYAAAKAELEAAKLQFDFLQQMLSPVDEAETRLEQAYASAAILASDLLLDVKGA
jgi:hypothetical protein